MTSHASHKTGTPISGLDELTGGAFTAETSGERTARIRSWLQQEPPLEQLQLVFKELSAKDKGAARPVRERMDELRRAKEQESVGREWAEKAERLLEMARMNMADALAWQRDAAKAGAPLSREPLAGLKLRLAERVAGIEDLQHRIQVQREAAVLLSQRIDVLSTKSWEEALTVSATLASDVDTWYQQSQALMSDVSWVSLDLKFPPLLETARSQLTLVWEAFREALAQAQRAASDPAAALPSVPVWAEELRVARGGSRSEAAPAAAVDVDPEIRKQSAKMVVAVLAVLEKELAEGHGKASVGAAGNLRQALKDHGAHLEERLHRQAQVALAAADELEGWQRWRADQLRQELVGKAEALLKRPEGQALGGRKLQESLRDLRSQWKQVDQGGVANHALWKRFDDACNQAYQQVQAWHDKLKAQAAEVRQQRLALIEELTQWAAGQAATASSDWKAFHRSLHQFAERWREAGHLSEKAFAELQPQWKAAMAQASAPLDAVQKESLQSRQAMIEEAIALGGAPTLRIDAVKTLQQRWQAEAHAVPLERRQEQKLWDAFRKPLDEAFARKSAARGHVAAAMSAHDQAVLDAAKALEAANAAGDAQLIREALQALEQARRGAAEKNDAVAATDAALAAKDVPSEAAAELVTPAAMRKPVVAVRGDDRPGMKRAETVAPSGRGRGGERGGDRGVGARRDDRGSERRLDRRSDSAGRHEDGRAREPRLGDAAFRAQRDAVEHAQAALKKLAAQAQGETVTHLLGAWEQRDADRLPSASELGGRVSAAVRTLWTQALQGAAAADGAQALLRLEIAAEVPTPAADLDARRALQLQLLTRRNDPAPAQTWGQDVARVFEAPYDPAQARRLQQVLKALLRR